MAGQLSQLQSQSEAIFTEGCWFGPYRHALQAMSAKEAAWSPGTGVHSIWQILNHVTFYTQMVAERIGGAPRRTQRPTNDETFGAQGDPADEAGWERARAALFAAAETYHAAIGQRTEQELAQPLPGDTQPLGELIADVNLHNAHHLGQIVTLLQVQGAWKPIDWS